MPNADPVNAVLLNPFFQERTKSVKQVKLTSATQPECKEFQLASRSVVNSVSCCYVLQMYFGQICAIDVIKRSSSTY
ncbi:hypothetical protein T07_12351 [Trichinella nelsoni]|uniref:Uncharacterized protein n=1 Tax=Trichinella nelsoni TaxID=6336 RepID=A0A0V0RTG9_9BILA|nr:hypothetical protein T07_12351 [Trichinella nelsoni]